MKTTCCASYLRKWVSNLESQVELMDSRLFVMSHSCSFHFPGAVLVADGDAGEACGAGRGCCAAVDEQRVPRHAERIRPQPARFYHPAGLHQSARVHPAAPAALPKDTVGQLKTNFVDFSISLKVETR